MSINGACIFHVYPVAHRAITVFRWINVGNKKVIEINCKTKI